MGADNANRRRRLAAHMGVVKRVQDNDASMYNALPSTAVTKYEDHCCGIHGAARERKGIKRGTSAARRRHDKQVIKEEVEHDV